MSFNLWTQFLILLGFRCPDCGGKHYADYIGDPNEQMQCLDCINKPKETK